MAQRVPKPVGAVIRHTPGVCGGVARIGNHRIPVWLLESLRRVGNPDEEILEGYPALTAEDLAAVWAYVDSHPAEIERDLLKYEQD